MSERRIEVAGVSIGEEVTNFHIVVLETEEVDGKPQEAPVGESFFSLPNTTTGNERKKAIHAQAKEVVTAADKAKSLRAELNAEMGEVEI